jgi:hypothetical protein
MGSGKPSGASSKLMGLKFMQRAQAKTDLSKKKEEQKKAQQEVSSYPMMFLQLSWTDLCFSVHSKLLSGACTYVWDDFVQQPSHRPPSQHVD